MKFNRLVVSVAFLVAITWGGTAQAANYLLGGKSGAKLQIGTGLPLPIGPSGIFQGGKTSVNGGTSCGNGPGGCTTPFGNGQSPDGPGTAYWPTLGLGVDFTPMGSVPVNVTVSQTGGTPNGGAIKIPASVLKKAAPGTPTAIGVFTTNPALFQVATSIDFAWPAASATLAPGGAPGSGVFGAAGGIISYNGGAFGGPAQFAIAAGPGAAGGRVPPNTAGKIPIASVFINFAGALPSTAGAVAIAGASNPLGVAAPGASLAAATATTMFGPLTPGAGPFGALNVTSGGSAMNCVAFCVTTIMGTINSSFPLPSVTVPTGGGGTIMLAGLSNMVTASKGFPWTTGFLTISQPAAGPPEVFWLSGTDMRVAGVGNVSLVSGALSQRALSGPNANRGWVSLALPEPGAALGATGALAMLGVCHGLVRRRSR